MATRVEDDEATGVGQKTLVYLVRHGETEWNVERRFQGQLDIELSKTGLLQADAVAQWLASQPTKITAIYSSDLKRASLTARVIGGKLGLVPQLDPALREINVGEWSGLVADEIEHRYPGKLKEWHEKVDSFTLPGGESIPIVQERVFNAYRQIVEQHPGEAIVIVSHGAALTALMAALRDWDLVETWQTRRARMGNTHVSVAVFDHDLDKHEVLVMDSGEHLEPPIKEATASDAEAP